MTALPHFTDTGMPALLETPSKRCRKCGAWKPATLEHFYNRKGYQLQSWCKPCMRARMQWLQEQCKPKKPQAHKRQKQLLAYLQRQYAFVVKEEAQARRILTALTTMRVRIEASIAELLTEEGQ